MVDANPGDLLFWLSLGIKLLFTAGIVVFASVVVERSGPVIGALVVTLPVTVWPAYVFLSLDHDAEFIAASARSGLAANAASAVLMLVYLALAQTRGLITSLAVAVACWIAFAWFTLSVRWTVGTAVLLNVLVYVPALALSGRFRHVQVPRIVRQWYEIPLRTTFVCALIGAVLALSHWLGPAAVGMLAVYPISTTSTIIILHSRLGGRVSAAVIANGLWGLVGIGGGLFALSAATMPLGAPAALTLALAVPITWNLGVWVAMNRGQWVRDMVFRGGRLR